MRLLFSTTLIAASLTLAFPDAAPGQIGNPGGNPGQTSPFPGGGGGRNGGQYPGGGRGGRGGGADRPGLPSKSRKNKNEPLPTVSTTGILRLLGTGASSDRFVLEADDHRIITFRTGDRTRVLKETKPVELSSFSKGDHLTVDATSDEEGNFTAVEIAFFSSGTPGDRAAASRTFDLPDLKSEAKADRPKPAGKAASSSDDDQRPVMRRPGDPPKSAAQPDEAQKSDAKQDASTGAAIATAADPDDTRPKTQMVPADAPADADDPGRPQLRRGGVSPRSAPGSAPGGAPAPASASTASNRGPSARPENSPLGGVTIESKVNGNSSENAAATSIIPVEEDPLIMKAKAAAADYTDTLPNYLVKQNTTRYDSDNPKNGWDAHDVVTADVTYKDGNQEYANVKVGNRSVKSIMDTGGQSSTGEFATWIEDIFSPTAAARFRRSGQETVNGRPCVAFKYEVTRERSHWRVSVGPQIYYPAYRGTVWIDRESSRVMRLEVESRGIPLLFPLEKVEMAMDYDFVRLASPRPFLLPTVAEVLSCQQGSTRCSRNRIEFRNYRKFGAESEITFEDKQ